MTDRALTIGNIITAALRLYLKQPRRYLVNSLVAHLWLLVPIYGWLKFAAASGRIARLFWLQIGDRTESKAECDLVIKSNFIKFWFIHLLVYFLFVVITVIAYISLVIAFVPIYLALNQTGQVYLINLTESLQSGNTPLLNMILGGFLIGFFAFFNTIFYARVFLSELPLAVKPQTRMRQAVRQSWQLTTHYIRRVAAIIWLTWLLTVPLALFLGFLLRYLVIPFVTLIAGYASIESVIFLVPLVMLVIQSLLTLPFWQAVKALTYYDLRNRKEGIGLMLQER